MSRLVKYRDPGLSPNTNGTLYPTVGSVTVVENGATRARGLKVPELSDVF